MRMINWIFILFLLSHESYGRVTFDIINPYQIVTQENKPKDTTLGTLKASSNDVESIIFELSSQNYIGVETESGRLYNKIILDREKTGPVIALKAFAYTNPSQKAELSILLEVQNVNDHVPIFEKQNYVVNVSENIGINSLISTIKASDVDPDDELLLYSFSNKIDAFKINRLNGEVRTNKTLDYEEISRYDLVVLVTDGTFTSSAPVTINILDIDDNGPVFNQSSYNVIIKETFYSKPTELLQVYAEDEDGTKENNEIAYSLNYNNSQNSPHFTIDENFGTIYIEGDVDREKKSVIIFSVYAVSTKYTAEALVTINITDVNDNKPYFEHDVYNGTILEGSANATIVLTLVAVHNEQTSSANDQMLTYSIVHNSSTNFPFKINDQGQIYVSGEIDRETKTSHTFHVKVEEKFGKEKYFNTTRVFIEVLDANDNTPEFLTAETVFHVEENLPPPQFIYHFKAVDKDIGKNGDLLFAIFDSENAFRVNSSTGVLETNMKFDRESKSFYKFKIRATDQAINGKIRSAEQIVTVHITDINDNLPKCQNQLVEIIEGRPIGTFIASILAYDLDEFGNYTYKIINGSHGDFQIHPISGRITTLKSLNRETISFYSIRIQASDTFNQSAICHVNVTVLDINDNNPRFDKELYEFDVAEGSIGLFVGIINATDKDPGLAGIVRYYILDKTPFEINSTTGLIKTKEALDRESKDIYLFRVQARDSADDYRTSQAQVEVSVIDINDNSPSFKYQRYETIVNYNVPIETNVFTFMAGDDDIGDNADIMYKSITPLPDYLYLQKETGDLKVIGSINVTILNDVIEVAAVNTMDPHGNDTTRLEITYTANKNNAPQFSKSFYNITINENLPITTNIVDLDATYKNKGENKNFTFAMVYGDVGYFSINPENGIIYAKHVLDRETKEIYNIFVSVGLKGEQSLNFARITINLIDVNDNIPMFTKKYIQYELMENTGGVIPTEKCIDQDEGINSLIKYSINGSEFFTINETTGEVHLIRTLNYEEDPHTYNLTITCYNIATPNYHSNLSLFIVLKDKNDNGPKVQKQVHRIEIVENNDKEKTKILRINASDIDGGMNGELKYFLIFASKDKDCFEVDQDDGSLYTLCRFDSELAHEYTLEIEVRDLGEPSLATLVEVQIDIIDVDDNQPRFEKEKFTFYVEENNSINYNVGSLDIVDADISDKEIPCQDCVMGSYKEYFKIDSKGDIYATKTLDRERQALYIFTVNASKLPEASTCQVTIHVTDVNDNVPTFENAVLYTGIINTFSFGGIVTTVSASDPDETNQLDYSIVSGNTNQVFSIDSKSGVIRTAKSLLSMKGSVFTLIIKASERTTNTIIHSANQSVVVFVFDKSSITQFYVSLNSTYVETHRVNFERQLSNITKSKIFIYQIEDNLPTRSIVQLYGIDSKKEIISSMTLTQFLSNSTFWNIVPVPASQTDSIKSSESDAERQLLIGIIVGVSVLVLALVMLTIYLWLRGEQRKRSDEVAVRKYFPNNRSSLNGFTNNAGRYSQAEHDNTNMYGVVDDGEDFTRTFLQSPSFKNPIYEGDNITNGYKNGYKHSHDGGNSSNGIISNGNLHNGDKTSRSKSNGHVLSPVINFGYTGDNPGNVGDNEYEPPSNGHRNSSIPEIHVDRYQTPVPSPLLRHKETQENQDSIDIDSENDNCDGDRENELMFASEPLNEDTKVINNYDEDHSDNKKLREGDHIGHDLRDEEYSNNKPLNGEVVQENSHIPTSQMMTSL